MSRKIGVLIIDDSAVMRQALTALLQLHSAIEVLGVAADPIIAWEKIKALKPDVLTLDVEMPRMDGLTFLEKLMQSHPMPVLMVSSLTEAGCETTLRALELGAVDFITKPKVDLREHMDEIAQEIIAKVLVASSVRLFPRVGQEQSATTRAIEARTPSAAAAFRTTERVIAVGASTGGTVALKEFLAVLPADAPGVVIVQHMPEKFTHSFAQHCDRLCTVRVKEAEDGDRVLPGHALIAPGNHHMALRRSGARYFVQVYSGAPVNRHRPSVDVLFESTAECAGRNAVGVIMTGMGADGAQGLLRMREEGARTIAQDEATCVVFGMPKEAIALGAVEQVIPLPQIAPVALQMAS